MQFAVTAFLRPGAEEELIEHSGELNEQVGADGTNVLLAGVLRDEEGKRIGYLALFEGKSIAEAREWVRDSPIYRDHLYERLDIAEYEIEVGRLS
jgi:uncharacterized protein YciI